MKVLMITDLKDGQHLEGEILIRNYYAGETLETKDLNSVTTGDITTWIGTLTDDNYDKIHILVNANVTAGTGVLSKLQYSLLVEKLDQTAVNAILLPEAEGTCQSNATATDIILASAQTEADDYFNDMIVVTAGTTVKARVINDYTQSSDTCTVDTTTTAITTTETYKIFTVVQMEASLMPVYAETYEGPEVFSALYPNMTNIPLIVGEMGAMPASPCLTATANSVATSGGVSTLTDTGNFVAGAYDDGTYYVGIRSSTTGFGQVLRIISNTADVLTLDGNWDPLPVTSIVYEIVDNKRLALARYFLQFAFRHLVADPSDQNKINEVMNMVSKNLAIGADDTLTFQDLVALEEFKAKGQTIMRAIGMGITS